MTYPPAAPRPANPFLRREAAGSRPGQLVAGVVLAVLGLLIAVLPAFAWFEGELSPKETGASSPTVSVSIDGWGTAEADIDAAQTSQSRREINDDVADIEGALDGWSSSTPGVTLLLLGLLVIAGGGLVAAGRRPGPSALVGAAGALGALIATSVFLSNPASAVGVDPFAGKVAVGKGELSELRSDGKTLADVEREVRTYFDVTEGSGWALIMSLVVVLVALAVAGFAVCNGVFARPRPAAAGYGSYGPGGPGGYGPPPTTMSPPPGHQAPWRQPPGSAPTGGAGWPGRPGRPGTGAFGPSPYPPSGPFPPAGPASGQYPSTGPWPRRPLGPPPARGAGGVTPPEGWQRTPPTQH